MTERNPSPVDTRVLMRYDLRLPSGFQITPVNAVSHAGCNIAMQGKDLEKVAPFSQMKNPTLRDEL